MTPTIQIRNARSVKSVQSAIPKSRPTVQILDKRFVNNNFYCDFQRTCDESVCVKFVALVLRGDARSHASNSVGDRETVRVSVLSFTQKPARSRPVLFIH